MLTVGWSLMLLTKTLIGLSVAFLSLIIMPVGIELVGRWLGSLPTKTVNRKDWLLEIKWERSIILLLLRLANNAYAVVSPIRRLWRLLLHIGIDWSPWWVEIWLFYLIAVLLACVFLGVSGDPLIWWIALLALSDSVGATIRDIAGQLTENKEIQVYNAVRWLLMAALSVVQVSFCFAVFILYYGDQFKPQIKDGVSAIYFSGVTMSTLGYGDISPMGPQAKVIVLLELIAFLMFLAIKLPIAVALIRVKELPETTT